MTGTRTLPALVGYGVTRACFFLVAAISLAACSGGDPAVDATTAAPGTAVSISATTTAPSTSVASITAGSTATTATTVGAVEIAWSEFEAERDVENYLAALAAGAFEQAGWPSHPKAPCVVLDGQRYEETPAQFLERSCQGGRCNGPYTVTALGPGVIDPEFGQASSEVLVTHALTGAESVIRVATFEWQKIIGELPPLVRSEQVPGLVETLFGAAPSEYAVVQRFEAFEIWRGGSPDWVTNWRADGAYDLERDWAAVSQESGTWVVAVADPTVAIEAECPELMSRNGRVVVVERCVADQWLLFDPATGEELEAPVPVQELGDGEAVYFEERGGVVVYGRGDAEGNLIEAATSSGVDLLGGDDYAGLTALSLDGRGFAYADHADPAAYSHFWSPVVVVRDTATGDEIGRWTLEGAIGCLEFGRHWVVACVLDGSDPTFSDAQQTAVVAINPDTGETNRFETRTRVFLP